MKMIKTKKKTFNEDVLQKERALVYFGAPWCHYCVELKPTLEEVATENPDYPVVEVNVDMQKTLTKTYGIELYPTVVMFEAGEPKGRIVAKATKEELEKLMGLK